MKDFKKRHQPQKLTSLLEGISYTATGADDILISDVCYDSRKVTPGSLFVCLLGSFHDGHDFAADAVKRGASALMVERSLDLPCPQIIVENTRKSLAQVAVNVFSHPCRDLTVVGVTGTNGKTTIVHMLKSIMGQAALGFDRHYWRKNRRWRYFCHRQYHSGVFGVAVPAAEDG